MEVGVAINQYSVIEHIGRGGMADVWSARDTRLNRMVAIKTIAHGLSQDVDPVALFEREAQTIAQMEHPHILPIYDFGEYGGSLYIVMRYVTGGSLEDLLEERPLTMNETVRMGLAIAQALDHAHRNNVVHLDLKPPNILLDSSHSPYLADFGLATMLDPQGRARNPGSGTLLYMAPEQLTAEVIDHRADIYSFAIMVYHMLTGELPFEGMAPLALRQLQQDDQLPEVDLINPNVPSSVNEVLRRGTAIDPGERYATLVEFIEELRAIISDSVGYDYDGDGSIDSGFEPGFDPYSTQTEMFIQSDDVSLLEAVDIYTRARHVWAGGQGRFLLGITHFMLMNSYYQEAEQHGLNIDESGYQMLLRGALEHDYEIDYWWQQLDEDNQRWVCLHTIRSENPHARMRALFCLETLRDNPERATIPRLVAQALQVENYPEAKIAALKVLSTRAQIRKPQKEYEIATEYQGRLLTSMTRLGIQLRAPSLWQEAVYSPEIDLLIAEIALDREFPKVADFASRVVGQLHSTTAIRHIANEQKAGRPGALRSLALVRDEAQSLPPLVSRQARLYAWLSNTLRRITDEPVDNFLRFILALLGTAIGLGEFVYITYRSQAIFSPQRWANVISVGLVFGVFMGIFVLVIDQFPTRLKGFWPWWGRLLFGAILGFATALLIWGGYTWLFYQYVPNWELVRMVAFGTTFGFLVASMLNLRGWQALIITSLAIYLPLYAATKNICLLPGYFGFCPGADGFSVTAVAGLGILIGGIVAYFARKQVETVEFPTEWSNTVNVLISSAIGFIFSLLIWLIFIPIFEAQHLTWDGTILVFMFTFLISGFIAYILTSVNRVAFITMALVTFWVMYYAVDQRFQMSAFAPYSDVPILYYDFFEQAFTLAIPMAVIIALGGNAQRMFGGLKRWIGDPLDLTKERTTAFTLTLFYVLIASALISILAIFSIHKSIPWAVLWSAWAGITFVFALATWQWKRWGAQGLIVSSLVFVVLGILFDLFHSYFAFETRTAPAILTSDARLFWIPWVALTGAFAWGASKRYLWGALGLMFQIVAWFFIVVFSGLPDSLSAFAVTNAAAIPYVLGMFWDLFEPETEKAKVARSYMATRQATPRIAPEPIPEYETVSRDTPNAKPVRVITDAADMKTEFDVGFGTETEFDVAEMQTDIDVTELDTALDVGESKLMQTELDLGDFDIPSKSGESKLMQTELDLGDFDVPSKSGESKLMQTELDLGDLDIPSKSGKSKLMQTELDLDDLLTPPATEPKRPESQQSGFKIDTGLLGTSKESGDDAQIKPDRSDSTEPRRFTIKTDTLETPAVSDDSPAKPEREEPTEPRRFKINTGSLDSSKAEESPKRPGLKIDIGALKSPEEATPDNTTEVDLGDILDDESGDEDE